MEDLWWVEKRQKTDESQAEYTNSGVPGLNPFKNRYKSLWNRYKSLWANGRARGVRFWLDFRIYLFLAPNGPSVPVFGRCPIRNTEPPNTASTRSISSTYTRNTASAVLLSSKRVCSRYWENLWNVAQQMLRPTFLLLHSISTTPLRPDIVVFFSVIVNFFTEASGYLVPNLVRFDQNRVLWSLFGGENVPRFYRWSNLTKFCFWQSFSTCW